MAGYATTSIGIAADHGGFDLKQHLTRLLTMGGHGVEDFGNHARDEHDDYPDVVVPLAEAVARGWIRRGIAVCGSGVGVAIAANKVPGVRACLIHDVYCARQGVEDDDLNLLCLGGQVIGDALAWRVVQEFLAAKFSSSERHQRRLAKIAALE
ncbi:MAG TPA: RpiB/LacA/LacB family sugar-phosphate isomerase [Planctomycetota bacterium]|nr:RpiB/LacA/LacB family sugar-phosphate isomerase [Planctomycetota bacterium]